MDYICTIIPCLKVYDYHLCVCVRVRECMEWSVSSPRCELCTFTRSVNSITVNLICTHYLFCTFIIILLLRHDTSISCETVYALFVMGVFRFYACFSGFRFFLTSSVSWIVKWIDLTVMPIMIFPVFFLCPFFFLSAQHLMPRMFFRRVSVVYVYSTS